MTYHVLVYLQDRITARLAWVRAVLYPLRRRLYSLWVCRGGHTDTLVITSHHVYLHCATCQRNTAGWDCHFADLKGWPADATD